MMSTARENDRRWVQAVRPVVIILGVVLTLFWAGCSGSRTLDPAQIHGDPVVDAWYASWVDAGEPVLARNGVRYILFGKASWYGPRFHGRSTANGEAFDMYGLTAAHRTLPFGTVLRVTRPDTQQQILVRVNDRGPYIDGRIIDLSYGAAHDLGMVEKGVAQVQLDVVAWGSGRRVSAK